MADFLLAWGFMASAVISLLVISNPISTSAVFISLTGGLTTHKRRVEIAKKSIKYSAGILLFFSATGFLLFEVFGFSLGAFRIAGGVLLFTMSVSMMRPKPSEQQAEMTSQDISLVPLSIPFTSGPGTIVTVILLMSEALALINGSLTTGLLAVAGVYVGIAAVITASYLVMVKSEAIDSVMKEGGRQVVTKLMGLLVMAISVQFFINGIVDIIPALVAAAG